MAEGQIRKACNRCHAQKLSCKRVGDEACERCVRLKAECRSSLSLRYRKHQYQTEAPKDDRRVKRLSASSRSSPGRPELGPDTSPHSEEPTLHSCDQNVATDCNHTAEESMLEMMDFGFGFDDGHVFTPNANSTQPPRPITTGVDAVSNLLAPDSLNCHWSPHLSAISTSCPDAGFVPLGSIENSRRVQLQEPPFSASFPETGHSPHATAERIATATKNRSHLTHRETTQRQIMIRPSSIMSSASRGLWLVQISDINAKLWELASAMPCLVDTRDGTDTYEHVVVDMEADSAWHGFSLDTMFNLSRRLVQVLLEICPLDGGGESGNGEDDQPFCVSPDRTLDPGTGLLVLSTYVRLLDLYQKAFRLVRVELSFPKLGDTFRLCKLPDVSVGSFPVASSPSLQMVLIIRLAEEFLAQLRKSIGSLSPQVSAGGLQTDAAFGQSSIFAGVIEVSLHAIRDKEEQIRKELGEIRSRLEDSSGS